MFKHSPVRTVLTVAALLTTAAACGPLSNNSPVFNGHQNGVERASVDDNALHIVNERGQALAGAQVLIGTALNTPFAGNFLTADEQGRIEIPAEWVEPLPVTIEVPGHIRVTFFDRQPQGQTIVLREAHVSRDTEIKGTTTGFGTLKRDGIVDVGLVFPAIRRQEIVNFNVTTILSTQMDTISVIGQRLDLPSNLTLPKQSETYVLPITLNKPDYRMYVAGQGQHKMVALHARFPFKTVIDELRNDKTVFDVLNLFEFRSSSVRDITVTAPSTRLDMPVNEQAFNAKVPVTAPAYATENVMLSVALVDDAGLLYPTDVKRVDPGKTLDLRLPQTRRGHVLSVLRSASTEGGATGAHMERLSAVFAPANQSRAVEFLPIVNPPEIHGDSLVFEAPDVASFAKPVATYALLSEIELAKSGDVEYEIKKGQWELYATEWVGAFDIPQWPNPTANVEAKHRWEVVFLADQGGTPLTDAIGPLVLDQASHVTRNAVDF